MKCTVNALINDTVHTFNSSAIIKGVNYWDLNHLKGKNKTTTAIISNIVPFFFIWFLLLYTILPITLCKFFAKKAKKNFYFKILVILVSFWLKNHNFGTLQKLTFYQNMSVNSNWLHHK